MGDPILSKLSFDDRNRDFFDLLQRKLLKKCANVIG